METVITVVGLVILGVLALTVFGMTMGKKDMEDFECLSEFVNRCEVKQWNKEFCVDEYQRLLNGGRIPTEMMTELRGRIIKKFR